MIRYALKCTNAHSFESWFQSAEAYDSLLSGGMIVCPTCSDTDVEKTLMAPSVRAARSKVTEPAAKTPQAMVNAPDSRLSEAIRELRAHVEKNSEYVGPRFASEARAMHDGDLPHRSIYGEARADEAKKLIEDGVPALPLPFIPKQKTN